jgi:hypothetical protein
MNKAQRYNAIKVIKQLLDGQEKTLNVLCAELLHLYCTWTRRSWATVALDTIIYHDHQGTAERDYEEEVLYLTHSKSHRPTPNKQRSLRRAPWRWCGSALCI